MEPRNSGQIGNELGSKRGSNWRRAVAGLIELSGEAQELITLQSFAPAYQCEVRPGPDGNLWLGGAKFDSMSPDEARAEARKILILLNGLARLENQKHRNVEVGDAFVQNGRMHHYPSEPGRVRPSPGTSIRYSNSPMGGGHVAPPVEQTDAQRRARIAADPKLAEIANVFTEEMTWQRQRVAFERITALVGKGDNDLVKYGYATQPELTRLKQMSRILGTLVTTRFTASTAARSRERK
jgi:hypothetical protein